MMAAVFYMIAGWAMVTFAAVVGSVPAAVVGGYFVLNEYIAHTFKDDRAGWYTAFTGVELVLASYLLVATATGVLGPIGYLAAAGLAAGATITFLAGTMPGGWWSTWYDQLQMFAMVPVLVGLVAGALTT